jgi:uncharacterized protein YprB with RNaseH-like and TPR domain
MINPHEVVSKLKELAHEMGRTPTKEHLIAAGVSDYAIRKNGGFNSLLKLCGMENYHSLSVPEYNPKILVFDIETAPILAYVWGLFDQNVGLNQIYKDWHVMSWAAKWIGNNDVYYHDQRDAEKIEDDSAILKVIWSLLDEADIVLTQNGIKFDVKKLNARFIHHGFPPPSSFRHIDSLRIAKKHFAFTSNKLEYMTHTFNKKYKKLKVKKFSGFELWSECLKGNIKAWGEMEKYNRYDVLALEELYLNTLRAWDHTINFNVYSESFNTRCSCGSVDFKDGGPKFTNASKRQRFICSNCGKEHVIKDNLLSKEKRKSLTQ